MKHSAADVARGWPSRGGNEAFSRGRGPGTSERAGRAGGDAGADDGAIEGGDDRDLLRVGIEPRDRGRGAGRGEDEEVSAPPREGERARAGSGLDEGAAHDGCGQLVDLDDPPTCPDDVEEEPVEVAVAR